LYELLDQLADSEIVEYEGEERKGDDRPRQHKGARSRTPAQPTRTEDDSNDYYDDFDGELGFFLSTLI